MYQTKAELVLASGSPRRRELLSRLGLEFRVIPSELREDMSLAGSPVAAAQEWARRKAAAVAEKLGREEKVWCLAVDTIVVVAREVLGKPGSREEARSFLEKLSGRWHEVISAYCIFNSGARTMVQNQVSSQVKIAALAAEEIAAYLDTEEPYDKAGAYAAQGIGAFMVEEIQGSYTNVVGLPLTELVSDLKKLGIIAVKAQG